MSVILMSHLDVPRMEIVSQFSISAMVLLIVQMDTMRICDSALQVRHFFMLAIPLLVTSPDMRKADDKMKSTHNFQRLKWLARSMFLSQFARFMLIQV